MSHINVNHPRRAEQRDAWRLERAKLEVELKHAQQRADGLESDLSSIFDRLERGEPVELHIEPGKMMRITSYERVGPGWPTTPDQDKGVAP